MKYYKSISNPDMIIKYDGENYWVRFTSAGTVKFGNKFTKELLASWMEWGISNEDWLKESVVEITKEEAFIELL